MTSEYIVLSRTNNVAKNGAPYISLKLANLQETISVTVWDVPATMPPHVGQLIKFFNIAIDSAGRKSAKAQEMVPGDMPFESHPLYNLIPRPVTRDKWDACISNLASMCSDSQLKDFFCRYADMLFEPYSKWPAATSVHHAFHGGLLNHTYQMLHLLEGVYPTLCYKIKPERCMIAILFHDYGKIYEYTKEGEPTENMFLMGHIYISAHKLHGELEKAGIEDEEAKRIVHCVLAHHGQLEYGSPVVPCSQEATIVNLLDLMSARTDTIDSNGNMEKVFALNTTIVKD
ncbi:MAG: HD domain-containing protein [Bacteroidaceae bacterium]|nr:HD domain-containing protein [Bacteroidaceae bacterium]